jgi:hypothetical protein
MNESLVDLGIWRDVYRRGGMYTSVAGLVGGDFVRVVCGTWVDRITKFGLNFFSTLFSSGPTGKDENPEISAKLHRNFFLVSIDELYNINLLPSFWDVTFVAKVSESTSYNIWQSLLHCLELSLIATNPLLFVNGKSRSGEDGDMISMVTAGIEAPFAPSSSNMASSGIFCILEFLS